MFYIYFNYSVLCLIKTRDNFTEGVRGTRSIQMGSAATEMLRIITMYTKCLQWAVYKIKLSFM